MRCVSWTLGPRRFLSSSELGAVVTEGGFAFDCFGVDAEKGEREWEASIDETNGKQTGNNKINERMTGLLAG